jgi:hypothetical protein
MLAHSHAEPKRRLQLMTSSRWPSGSRSDPAVVRDVDGAQGFAADGGRGRAWGQELQLIPALAKLLDEDERGEGHLDVAAVRVPSTASKRARIGLASPHNRRSAHRWV